MPTIRHICAGHEFRYDTDTGEVRNNYGTVVSQLRFCRFTGTALLFRAAAHYPAIHAADKLTHQRGLLNATDAQLAEFAIGHTAVHCAQQ